MVMDLLHDTGVWVTFSFVIFVFILWRMGKQAVLNMLDERIAGIREELDTAENLRVESQELLAQYQRKHRDAVDEAAGIVANAQKHAAEILKNADIELKEITARREKQLEERIARLEQSAVAEIQKYAADLAISATQEIIVKELDKKTSEKLVTQSMKSLEGNIH